MKIRVRVVAQSKSEEVQMTGEGEFIVSVRAPAREGKANQALIGALATYFSVPKFV